MIIQVTRIVNAFFVEIFSFFTKLKQKVTRTIEIAPTVETKQRATMREDIIQATFHLISGCEDSQTSADVKDVVTFRLPDPAGRAGGACTTALLKVLYKEEREPTENLTFVEVLTRMREVLESKRFKQIPQLSSSKPMDVNTPFYLVPPDCKGTRRAVLIGIHYTGQQGELTGCHNDVGNMKKYIIDVWGFKEQNIKLLLDDGEHTEPTRKNIIAAYKWLVQESEDGDAAFCHFSGHGSFLPDDNGDEEDGSDETLIPVDYLTSGQIRDDVLYETLVIPMKKGVRVTATMDCCHSGTVLDLPYKFTADGASDEMVVNEKFDEHKIKKITRKVKDFLHHLFKE